MSKTFVVTNEKMSLSNQKETEKLTATSSGSTETSTSVQGSQAKKSVSFAGRSSVGNSSRGGGGGSTSSKSQKKPPPRRVPAPNLKQENIALLIKKKKEYEKTAHEIVLRLIEPEVSKEYLLENALKISKQHMEDVVEERKISQICGWVLCDKPIDFNKIPKQTYRIRGHSVYDISERKSFCCGQCYAKAMHFMAQLLTSPLWIRDMEDDVEFEVLEDSETKELHGLTVNFSSVNLSDESEDEDDSGKDAGGSNENIVLQSNEL